MEIVCELCGKFRKPFQFHKVNPLFTAGGLLHLLQSLAAEFLFQAIASGFSRAQTHIEELSTFLLAVKLSFTAKDVAARARVGVVRQVGWAFLRAEKL